MGSSNSTTRSSKRALTSTESTTYQSIGGDEQQQQQQQQQQQEDIEGIFRDKANGNGNGSHGGPVKKTSSEMSEVPAWRNLDEGLYIGNESIAEMETKVTEAEIDAAISHIMPLENSSSDPPVIRQYRPHKYWLWRQWYGTIFQYGIPNAIFYMAVTAIACYLLPRFEDTSRDDDPIDTGLKAFNQCWKYILTLTTFILTFFLNQSYTLWRNVYNLSRSVQGRTNDFGLLAATHATRDTISGEYTPQARALLENIAMGVRAFHAFAYASKTRIYRILHTDRAMERMVKMGVITEEMKEALQKLDISESNRVYAIIEWIIIQFRVGLEKGILKGGPGFEEKYLEKALLLRSQYGTFGDILDARIPLAYGHFVQVMVDMLLMTAPFACYKEMGYFSIVTVGFLTIFFSGLLDLAKVMLDPLDNEDYCDGVIDINVGVFIRESNNGSVRFYKGAEYLPGSWLK